MHRKLPDTNAKQPCLNYSTLADYTSSQIIIWWTVDLLCGGFVIYQEIYQKSSMLRLLRLYGGYWPSSRPRLFWTAEALMVLGLTDVWGLGLAVVNLHYLQSSSSHLNGCFRDKFERNVFTTFNALWL